MAAARFYAVGVGGGPRLSAGVVRYACGVAPVGRLDWKGTATVGPRGVRVVTIRWSGSVDMLDTNRRAKVTAR